MLTILFENEAILAVNKPSGTPSHSLSKEDENSVERILLRETGLPEIFLLHRLDTGTSGVLLFAKTKSVFEEMREKFKAREIEKSYVAFSELSTSSLLSASGAIHPSFQFPHRIETPLAHHPKSKKRMIVLPPDLHRVYRGKPIPAITILKGAEASSFEGIPAIRFEVEIVTGVMHQIRVHLASVGFPLIGDPIYGEKLSKEEIDAGKTLPRLGLHAEGVRFELGGYQYQIQDNFT